MRQDLADDKRIFDALVRHSGNNLHRTATGTADTHFYIEYTLQPLCLYALRVQHIPLRLLAFRPGSCRSSTSAAAVVFLTLPPLTGVTRSLAHVAMTHQINAKQLRRWQRELNGDFGPDRLLPVKLTQAASALKPTGYIDFQNQKNLPAMTHTCSDGPRFTVKPLEPRSSYQSVVSINHDRHYCGYEFYESLFEVGRLNVLMDYLHDGDTVTLELKSMPSNATLVDEDYSRAMSLNELRQ